MVAPPLDKPPVQHLHVRPLTKWVRAPQVKDLVLAIAGIGEKTVHRFFERVQERLRIPKFDHGQEEEHCEKHSIVLI